MAQFKRSQTLRDFQELVRQIYALPDDRFYSLWDLLTHVHRFAMRSLKGIRKDDHQKLKLNLLVAFSWLMAVANRLHIDIEKEVWRRFPARCPYCGKTLCSCKKNKSQPVIVTSKIKVKPVTLLSDFQLMFGKIYPPTRRTLADAGVHLAEETGEISEAVHHFLGEHLLKQFEAVILEIADCVSCIFGVANSAKINVAIELEKLFGDNCHACHQIPCVCTFGEVATIKT